MRIQDLLMDRQRRQFVGREAEFSQLCDLLSGPEQNWQLVNLYGPGGSGKTTLLRLFAQRTGWHRCLMVDGSGGMATPSDLLLRMRRELARLGAWSGEEGKGLDGRGLADALNAYAERQGGLLLLFDAFEKWGLIERWLREEWLPALHPRVRLCTAGRYPLEGEWLAGGWNLLVRNLLLGPLSPEEVTAYALLCGISDPQVIDWLKRLTGGSPLALAMASDMVQARGKVTLPSGQEEYQVVRHLMTQLLQDLKETDLHHYLEAASVVRRFDQELLQAILKAPVPAERFRSLCRLPFITKHDAYWMLHDSVRNWALVDFQARDPGSYDLYRMRALSAVRQRLEIDQDRRSDWLFDRLYLTENQLLRGLWLEGSEEYKIKPCRAQDLPRIVDLYRAGLSHQPGYQSDKGYLEPLIPALWAVAPEGFQGLWKEERLFAFGVLLPLNEQTIPLLRQNPITVAVADRYHLGEPQYLLSLAGYDPAMTDELDGALARALLRIFPRGSLIFIQSYMKEWSDYYQLMGFERAPWADLILADGVSYWGYQLDLRTEEHTVKIERLLEAMDQERPMAEPASPLPSWKEVGEQLRPVLRHFEHLHLHPNLVEPLQWLLPEATRSQDQVVSEVEVRIRQAVERIAMGSEGDRLMAQILQHAYLRKLGSHELVAEHLNLSVPTYYRHLRLAVHRLARELARAAPQ